MPTIAYLRGEHRLPLTSSRELRNAQGDMGEAARAYAEELSRFKYGHALWWPEPAEDSNGDYEEIDIGDVGRIDEDGAFQRLFNVTSGSPCPPPGDFTPLTYDKSLVTRKKRFFPSGPIHSSSVSSHKIVTKLSACVAV